MKYSRERDEICLRLCKMQSRMFKKASEEGIPSFFFVKAFACSTCVWKIDSLAFLDSNVSEEEIYRYVKSKVKTRRGTVYDSDVMGWIGYLLREWAYRYKTYTSIIMKSVDLTYLAKAYYPYHSLDILKAIKKIAEEKKIDLNEDPQERLIRILRQTLKPI